MGLACLPSQWRRSRRQHQPATERLRNVASDLDRQQAIRLTPLAGAEVKQRRWRHSKARRVPVGCRQSAPSSCCSSCSWGFLLWHVEAVWGITFLCKRSQSMAAAIALVASLGLLLPTAPAVHVWTALRYTD